MNGQYILNEKEVMACEDLMEWGKYMAKGNRMVDETIMGDVRVSTVFLGLDHGFGIGKPLVFETMIFGGEHDLYCDRYSTWDEAVVGHKAACELVNNSINQ